MSRSSLERLPQVAIFDWDNTLVENWNILTDSVNAALAAFNLPLWSVDQMIDNSKHSMRDSFPAIFGQDWHHARDVFYAHFREHHLCGLKKLCHAEDVLNLLLEHGVKLMLCSNKNGDLLRREVRHLQWNDYFLGIIGAADAEKDKPDSAPVKILFRQNNVKDYETVWFVGDTSADIICGAKSGCVTVGIGKGSLEHEVFQPSVYSHNLCELLTEMKLLLS